MSAPTRCEVCGERYADFRSGLSFADARAEMRVGGDDPERWRSLSRKAVLGFLHERKRDLWDQYHGAGRCAPDDDLAIGFGGDPIEWELVPF